MNNYEGHIDHLMILYLTNHANEQEKLEFESWLASSESNRLVFENIRKAWNENNDYEEEIKGVEEIGDFIWNQSVNEVKTDQNEKESPFLGVFSKVAAVISLLVLSGYVWYNYLDEYVNQIGTIPSMVTWVEKVNKKGEKKYYQLPDGSAVWLNSESTLRFVSEFADTVRKVELEGEAYFEVKKDIRKPFIVEVYGSSVVVLGTSFNVSSYRNDKNVRVALLEGKVKVENKEQTQMVMLSPGEELIASKDDDIIRKERFNYENTFGWKEGILSFDGVDFTEFKSKIERWYNVSIEVKGNAPDNWELRAKYKNEFLKNVLKDVSFNKGFKYRIENDQIVITF